MEQYKAGSRPAGYAITGPVGRHRFTLVDGSEAELFAGRQHDRRHLLAPRQRLISSPLQERVPARGTMLHRKDTIMLDKPATPGTVPARLRAGPLEDHLPHYTPADVRRLSGLAADPSHARRERRQAAVGIAPHRGFVPTLGTFTGNQAMQQVKAGLKAIYLSGWQVAADANTSGNMYPDQSLYPVDSVPNVVRASTRRCSVPTRSRSMERPTAMTTANRLVRADHRRCRGGLRRRAQRVRADEGDDRGGRGGSPLRGPARVGEEVRAPGRQGAPPDPASSSQTLNAARLAADVMGVPTLVMARTDAEAARLITSDIDRAMRTFVTGERTAEGFYHLKGGIDQRSSPAGSPMRPTPT
jgi:isocitrate lyase